MIQAGIRKKDKLPVVIKTVNKELKHRKEVAILKVLSEEPHPNIIRIYEVVETEENFHIVMEQCQMTLHTYACVKKLSEDLLKKVVRQIVSALIYLHSQGIVHRDLKPLNILLRKDLSVALIDFDLSAYLPPTKPKILRTRCGTPNFAAPEIYQGYDEKIDCWSLGVILYAMLTGGYLPYRHKKVRECGLSLPPPQFPTKLWKDISLEARDLVSALLTVNPVNRISAVDVLNHPWLREYEEG